MCVLTFAVPSNLISRGKNSFIVSWFATKDKWYYVRQFICWLT